MGVHHARDSVESEAVKHVLVHVEPQVGQQEPLDLVVSIVEQTAEKENAR
jgi:predicted transcriptional regulator